MLNLSKIMKEKEEAKNSGGKASVGALRLQKGKFFCVRSG